jgi:Leucine-rich repeat (LRR) protein
MNQPSSQTSFCLSRTQHHINGAIECGRFSTTEVERLDECEHTHITIIIENHNFEVFDVDTFENFTSLERLKVQKGKLSRVINGTFNATKNLVNLNLDSNFLDIQNVGCFTGLVNLESLSLSDNCLVCLPTGLFEGLALLKKVYLDNNYLQMLDLNMFIGLENLNVVALQRNLISTINSSKKLVSMKQLILRENNLTDVSALKTVRNLTFVNLSDNLELVLDSTSFENCTQLETLSLNNVTLARYENFYEFLKNLKKLKSLSTGKNNLTQIKIEELKFLKDLQKLTIDMNNLNNFDFASFLNLFTKIREVKIGGNNLKKFRDNRMVFKVGDSVISRPNKKCFNDCKIQRSSSSEIVEIDSNIDSIKPNKECFYDCKIQQSSSSEIDSITSIWFIVVLTFGFALALFILFYKNYIQRQEHERFQQGISFN